MYHNITGFRNIIAVTVLLVGYPLISMDKMPPLPDAPFDSARCATTKEALWYARMLYGYAQEKTKNISDIEYMELMQEAQQASNLFTRSHALKYEVVQNCSLCEFNDREIIATPTICNEGRFCAAPSSKNKVEIFDYVQQEACSLPMVATFLGDRAMTSLLAQFIGQKLVATGVRDDGFSYLTISESMPALVKAHEDALKSKCTRLILVGMGKISMADVRLAEEAESKKGFSIASNGIVLDSPAVALATTHAGQCATAHIKRDAGNHATRVQLYDSAILQPTRAHTIPTLIAAKGLAWHPYGDLLAVKMNNNSMQLFDCRAQAPVIRVSNVSSGCGFDFDSVGSRICMATELREIAIFDLGQQRMWVTPLLCEKPGIIVNIGNDCFTVSRRDEIRDIDLTTFSLNQLPDGATIQVTSPTTATITSDLNSINFNSKIFSTGDNVLVDIVASKATGQQLYCYRSYGKSIFAYITSSCMFDTKIREPRMHNIACLYALKHATGRADLARFDLPKNREVINDTCAKDVIFAQCMKALSIDADQKKS